MPDLEIHQSKKSITESDIDVVEKLLNFTFPSQIRKFYLRNNGGFPFPNCFEKNGEYWKINEFLSIKHGLPGNNFENCFTQLVKEGKDFFPYGLIPIAQDAGGDMFCFRVGPVRIGSICCWVADEYDNPDRAVVELAEDFDTFIDSLMPCPD